MGALIDFLFDPAAVITAVSGAAAFMALLGALMPYLRPDPMRGRLIPFRKCCFVSILSFRLTFVLMACCWSSSRPRHDTTMGSRPDVGVWWGSANRAEELR